MAAPRDLPSGARLLDRYVILTRVGSGGMASIYRAMDERLDRVVCVKLLRTLLEGDGSTGGKSLYKATYAHFLQEALALSRLQHPNTLRIYDFGYLTGSGLPFQISEYLDGGNLEQYVRERGAIAPAESIAILERITGAVEEAHAHKIIHRDIKPSNILFGRLGEYLMPKLADFGIAHTNIKKRKAHQDTWDEDTETVSTVALFSPRWASPEQLSGQPQGAATDVYALGLVAAYMLAGRPLFEGSDVRATFNERVQGDGLIERLLAASTIPRGLHPALASALTARAKDRTPTPTAFVEQLREAVQRSTRSSHPAPPSSHERAVAPAPPAPPPPLTGPPRFVDAAEKIDLGFVGARGDTVRFRLAFVPVTGTTFRVHVKGLTAFVAAEGRRASPAVTLSGDGVARFVAPDGADLGTVDVSFGSERADAEGTVRAFRGPEGEIVVPFTHAVHAVALRMGGELVVVCHR